jgi:hypothetical protein
LYNVVGKVLSFLRFLYPIWCVKIPTLEGKNMRIFDDFEHQIACHAVLTLWKLSV